MTAAPLPPVNCPEACRIAGHIPMAHAAEVDRAARFYSLLGFTCESRFSDNDGVTNWVMLASGAARIMIARAGEPVDPRQQAVLFYMYSRDVMALRMHLLNQGLVDGGTFREEGEAKCDKPVLHERGVVFRPTFPFYMPQGEIRIHDPEGYCILVGQAKPPGA